MNLGMSFYAIGACVILLLLTIYFLGIHLTVYKKNGLLADEMRILRARSAMHEHNAKQLMTMSTNLASTGKFGVDKFHIAFPTDALLHTDEGRAKLVRYVAGILNIPQGPAEIISANCVQLNPYEWAVGRIGQPKWRVVFDQADPRIVRILHSYNMVLVEYAVAALLTFHYDLGAVIVNEGDD